MTAIFAYAYSDRIEVLTDTATTDEDGMLTAYASKLMQLEGNSLSLAATGEYLTAITAAVNVLQDTMNMDATTALDKLPEIMKTAMGEKLEVPIAFNVFSFPNGKPTIHTINSFQLGRKFRLTELMPLAYLGAPLGNTFYKLGINQAKLDEGLKPIAFDLFNAIRSIPQANLSTGKKNVCIGGALVLTTIRPNKRETEILGRWQDERGCKLNGTQELIQQAA